MYLSYVLSLISVGLLHGRSVDNNLTDDDVEGGPIVQHRRAPAPLPDSLGSLELSDPLSSLVPLSLEELAREGISPQEFIEQVRSLARRKHECPTPEQIERSKDMIRYFITNQTVTCNDGSPAGYYIRKSPGSSSWMIYLEGGWFCFDESSCRGRWVNAPHLMSSHHWPPRKRGQGITSWDSEENPYLHDVNIIHLPYCSSDSWSGTNKSTARGEFSFMGALILESVVRDLVTLHGLAQADQLLLTGSSAGGTGVLLNLDHISDVISSLGLSIQVRGVADSGWFLDNRQYRAAECTDVHQCAPTESIQKGYRLWAGRIPQACAVEQNRDQQWKCYFGYKIYETLKSPVFVIQNQFDEAQITANNVGPPTSKHQWQYIHRLGKDLKRTLRNVSAVFSPACLSHMILNRREWSHVAINGVTLPEAIKCWQDSNHEKNRYPETGMNRNHYRPLGDDPNSMDTGGRKGGRRKKKDRRRNNKRKKKRSRGASPHVHHHQSDRSPRSAALHNPHDLHHMRIHDNRCTHHLLDHCAWPQCNLSCPKIYNPFTGEQLDFVDLLYQFGLDLTSIANALGMDLATLQSMDHAVLLEMLTQNT